MMRHAVNVLLVEENAVDARRIRHALADDGDSVFRVHWVKRISAALDRLTRFNASMQDRFDVILLDPSLPDANGEVTAFNPLFEAAPQALILVLSNANTVGPARALIKRGAFDYLEKQYVNSHWLSRALRYVTERKSAEIALRRSEDALFEAKERAQITLDSIGDAVIATDISVNVTYLNLMAETLTGWRLDEAMGRPLTEVIRIVEGNSRMAAENPALRAISEDQIVGLAANSVLIRRDGVEIAIEDSTAPIHNRDGSVSGAVMVFRDVSAARAKSQKMTHLAQHDALTGLPNRLLLQERLEQAMAQARRHRRQMALLFLDLDYFKYVNDSLGHDVGDELLISVVARLQTCIRASDTVCRQGGDEFVILLTQIEQPQDAAQVAGKILSALSVPHLIGTHELHVTISIGISVYPNDGATVNCLMKNADTAMYHAKSNGRNNFRFFRDDMNSHMLQCLAIEDNLRRAITRKQFVLHYQPKFGLESGVLMGAEALLRWQSSKKGLLYPTEFMSVAEESGLVVPIGRWVLREVCSQIRAWLDCGFHAVPVSVKVSATESRHPQFANDLEAILAETGLPAHYLKIELSEGVESQNQFKRLQAPKGDREQAFQFRNPLSAEDFECLLVHRNDGMSLRKGG